MNTEDPNTEDPNTEDPNTEDIGPESANGARLAGHGILVHAGLAADPISLDQALAAVDAPDCGAVVGFSGVVRNHDGGRSVSALSYSAHPSAEQVFAAVVDQISVEFPGVRLWAQHRTGSLQIGDPALVCAAAAAHRGLAFAACSALVDRIKADVPIWKEQFFSDGTVEWVGAVQSPAEALDSAP